MKPAYVHFNASAFFPQDSQRSCENLNSALFTRKAISSPKTNHSLGTTANDSEMLNSILQKWLIKLLLRRKDRTEKHFFTIHRVVGKRPTLLLHDFTKIHKNSFIATALLCEIALQRNVKFYFTKVAH